MQTPALNALVTEIGALASLEPALQKKCQDFFAAYAFEMNKPSYGSGARDFAVALLHRATEAGLYEPPPKEQ